LDRSRFRVEVLEDALALVQSKGADPSVRIAGHPAAEPALRDGLEAAYRDLAAHTASREERVHLVDQANTVRRWTLR
jgi:serine/threonine-protein kinase PknG